MESLVHVHLDYNLKYIAGIKSKLYFTDIFKIQKVYLGYMRNTVINYICMNIF